MTLLIFLATGMALFVSCKGLLKVNPILNWSAKRSNVSLTRRVIQSYRLCTNKYSSIINGYWSCEFYCVSRWACGSHRAFPTHRGREECTMHRLFSSESKEPPTAHTDPNKPESQEKLISDKTNECENETEDIDVSREQAELYPHGSQREHCGTTHSSNGFQGELEPQDAITIKDYDLTQLLENIQEAQLTGSLSTHKTGLATRQREFRTSPMTIDDLVEFLREERAQDICVINVPPEREYVKYFVTCTGQGVRHIRRMADSLVAEVCIIQKFDWGE